MKPTIVWFRQDLRLRDHPALIAAVERGGPVLPVYIWAPQEEGDWPPGAASRVWVHHSLASLRDAWRQSGGNLLIFRGASLDVLRRLVKSVGAGAVYWNRRYEPAAIARDTQVKKALTAEGIQVESFNGSLLWEPWEVCTKSGGPYQVFTPFWRTVLQLPPPEAPLPTPSAMRLPDRCPKDDGLDALGLLPPVRWDGGILDMWSAGEASAHRRLRHFVKHGLGDYDTQRHRPDRDGSSRLSPYLHHGELSPRQVWHEVLRGQGQGGAYLREIAWREFAYHLLYHFPHTPTQPLRREFDRFPWRRDEEQLRAWQRGRTGYPIVDAGMRQLWHTGWMHNRVRMIVASFLVKDLRISWLEGARWFWDTLVDADLANNTLGWQWAAGCGADAAPYFRVFNPVLQGGKFDPDGRYVRQYIPELAAAADRDLHRPRHEGHGYPPPIVDHGEARDAALAAYERIKRAYDASPRTRRSGRSA